jgi:hypothetical protein
MSDIHAHQLHQMMRSWLLAEDPYGLNQRIEPTFGTQSPPGAPASGGAASAPSAPATGSPDEIAAAAPALRAQNYGRGAVQRELEKPTPQNVNSEAFQGARDPRAQAQGEQAVGRSTAPSPTAEVDRTRGQMWGEDAVDKALNPPTGGGGGFWMPGEAADTASAVGQQAVEGALAKKARGKIAKGRLSDPQDPDDRQPE